MPLVHSFRLRDPWQCSCGDDGRAVWTRGFQRPTGLEPGDELWLVISELPAGATVAVNDVPLASTGEGAGGPFRVHDLVTGRRNLITIAEPNAPPADGLFPYEAQLGVVVPEE
ncbi:MAG: hypothetical protein KDA44_11480 [Planctomycetales bacterium]|nr:hypothetical protein [Planctomycetales bacterium]